jgi:hypothetical protein
MFKRKNFWRSLSLLSGLLVFSACSQFSQNSQEASEPKRRLSDYISKSFAVSSEADRAQLLTYLTGDAKTRLAAWSDEQFRQAFIDSKRQFQKLLIREVKREGCESNQSQTLRDDSRRWCLVHQRCSKHQRAGRIRERTFSALDSH